jgi:hypothetical protein
MKLFWNGFSVPTILYGTTPASASRASNVPSTIDPNSGDIERIFVSFNVPAYP